MPLPVLFDSLHIQFKTLYNESFKMSPFFSCQCMSILANWQFNWYGHCFIKKKLMIWTLHPVYLYVHLFSFFFFQTINTSLICENYFWYFNCGGGIIYMIIIKITIICVSFVFNDRIMQYNACIYYMLNCVRVSSTSQTTHNCELRLKHFKCSFHILLG